MRVRSAEFVLGVAGLKQLPRKNWPEIAWAGRSNVGKSSLINSVLSRKGLARISNKPGKTRQLNFYAINNAWYLVDLPGYGFARGPAAERQGWGKLVEPYLSQRTQLAGVAVLVDSRHGATELDKMMFEWLAATDTKWTVVLAKCDKISGNALTKVRGEVSRVTPEGVSILACSALSGRGIEDVRGWVDGRLEDYRMNTPELAGWQMDIEAGDDAR
jgi:GTP-binding protein